MSHSRLSQNPPNYDSVSDNRERHNNQRYSNPILNEVLDNPIIDRLEDPGDFKYGPNVIQSAIDIRHGFIRQVYGALFLQLLINILISMYMRTPEAFKFINRHPSVLLISVIVSLSSFFSLWWMRRSHPWNVILLLLFTITEGFMIGVGTAMYEASTVIQSFIFTAALFAGLTLYSMQSRYEILSWIGVISSGIWMLFGLIFIQILMPFSSGLQIVISVLISVIFSAYILYDTKHIMIMLHPDDWVMGCISLYLDFANIFINILRIFGFFSGDAGDN